MILIQINFQVRMEENHLEYYYLNFYLKYDDDLIYLFIFINIFIIIYMI